MPVKLIDESLLVFCKKYFAGEAGRYISLILEDLI